MRLGMNTTGVSLSMRGMRMDVDMCVEEYGLGGLK